LVFASRLPGLDGATAWLNVEALTMADLDGKVVLVDIWTYTCINWIRTLPYIRSWAATYGPQGLVVIGVHTPEFGVEHDVERVRRATHAMRVEYPIAVDNDYAVWDAFSNRYWPALYLADPGGRIRHHHFGEGGYDKTEEMIRRLLTDAGARSLPGEPAPVHPTGIEAQADWDNLRSPETYVGLARSEGFASPQDAVLDVPRMYSIPDQLSTNEWALDGNWRVGTEDATLTEPGGRIAYRFHARDLHLILAPPADGAPVRVRVRLDGQPPQDAHGLDVDYDGNGLVDEARLYQLIRQPGPINDHLFEIELVEPGLSALCFTFG
jgi:hypothetical protein